MKINVDNLREKLGPLVESLGFELAELSAPVVGGRLILRAYIHSATGVTLDNCAMVSRQISDYLDTEDLVAQRYTLEVSSLGLDRPLLSARDFQRRIGELVRISYKLDGQEMSVEGILKNCDESGLQLDRDGQIVTISLEANPRGKILI